MFKAKKSIILWVCSPKDEKRGRKALTFDKDDRCKLLRLPLRTI